MLEKRSIKIGEYTVDVRSNFAAHSESILLIHGIGVSGTYFVPFAEELARSYNVFALDLPGYGGTPDPRHVLTISDLSDVVAQVTQYYHLDKPIIVGHSMGSQIVAQVAMKNPDMFKKMILLAPTINRRERTRLIQSLRLLQDTLHESFKLNCIVTGDYLHMGISRYLKTSGYMIRDQIEEHLAKCELPVLIVRGKKDVIVPKDWVQFLQTVAPSATIKEIPGAPHNVQYSHVKQLAKICNEFIQS
jgi:pimeloyl-ACP methyl ester carboxylesterase